MELPQQVLRVYGVVEHFLIECIPVRNLGAIRHTHHQNRQAGFAGKTSYPDIFCLAEYTPLRSFPRSRPRICSN